MQLTDYGLTGKRYGYKTAESVIRLKNLEKLYVKGRLNRFTDVTLRHLSQLKNLRILHLKKSKYVCLFRLILIKTI